MAQDLRILVVENDADFRQQTVRSLLPFNEVTEAESLQEARAAITRKSFDVAILDKNLPDGDAIEIVPEISANHPNCAILVLTGDDNKQVIPRYMAAGVHDYVEKTEFAVLDLKIRIPAVLASLAHQRKSQALDDIVAGAFRHEIVGKSEATRRLRERVLSLKGSRFPVLITGESGTGKESIARMLHKIERPGRPFVIVNCGAIAENLVESELFGHVKGAFTGAVRDQIGKFELAHQGDIFLDEFGELPLAVQVKLLRVLQDGSFYRVGDRSERRVSVRVIAATNRDLAQLVREGKFREDLYFRVNVIPIHATPLRERVEDIADIAQFLLTIHGKGRFTIAPEALAALSQHSWPGNVRELGNATERAIIEAKIRGSRHIEMADFGSIFETGAASGDGAMRLPARAEQVSLEGLEEYVRQAERKYLAKSLGYFGGSVTALAEQMGLSRSALFRRVANVGLSGQRPGLTTAIEKEPANATPAHR